MYIYVYIYICLYAEAQPPLPGAPVHPPEEIRAGLGSEGSGGYYIIIISSSSIVSITINITIITIIITTIVRLRGRLFPFTFECH